MKKEFPKHSQKVMFGLWGQSQMSYCKTIVTVDEEIDPKNISAVIETLLSNLDIQTDIIRTQGVLDVLDHASPTPIFGGKLGIDLTRRFPGEPDRSFTATNMKAPPPTEELLKMFQRGCEGIVSLKPFELSTLKKKSDFRNRILFIGVKKGEGRSGKYFSEKLLSKEIETPFNLMILFDADADLSNHSYLMWKLFNNVDPDRDIRIREACCVVDACRKGPEDGHLREWPEELTFN